MGVRSCPVTDPLAKAIDPVTGGGYRLPVVVPWSELWAVDTGATGSGCDGCAISRCACRSVRDGRSPAGTLDEAKWMPGRISKHAFAVEFGRAKTKHVRRRVGDTLDHDVEVHLLRDGRVRPGRRTMVGSELEREAGGRLVSRDDYEIVACVGDRMVQECGVEPCEPSRVRTVEDDVVQASAHALNGLIRRPQLPEQQGRVGCWGWSYGHRCLAQMGPLTVSLAALCSGWLGTILTRSSKR